MSKIIIFAALSTSLLTAGLVLAWKLRGRGNQSMSSDWQQDELPAHEHEQQRRDGFLWVPEI